MTKLYTGTVRNTTDNKLFTYEGILDIVRKGKKIHREFSNIKRLNKRDALDDARWIKKNYLGTL